MTKIEFDIDGKKYWYDYNEWRLQVEYTAYLQGQPNEYNKYLTLWEQKNQTTTRNTLS